MQTTGMEGHNNSLRGCQARLKELELAGNAIKTKRMQLEKCRQEQLERARQSVPSHTSQNLLERKFLQERNMLLLDDIERASRKAAAMGKATRKMLKRSNVSHGYTGSTQSNTNMPSVKAKTPKPVDQRVPNRHHVSTLLAATDNKNTGSMRNPVALATSTPFRPVYPAASRPWSVRQSETQFDIPPVSPQSLTMTVSDDATSFSLSELHADLSESEDGMCVSLSKAKMLMSSLTTPYLTSSQPVPRTATELPVTTQEFPPVTYTARPGQMRSKPLASKSSLSPELLRKSAWPLSSHLKAGHAIPHHHHVLSSSSSPPLVPSVSDTTNLIRSLPPTLPPFLPTSSILLSRPDNKALQPDQLLKPDKNAYQTSVLDTFLKANVNNQDNVSETTNSVDSAESSGITEFLLTPAGNTSEGQVKHRFVRRLSIGEVQRSSDGSDGDLDGLLSAELASTTSAAGACKLVDSPIRTSMLPHDVHSDTVASASNRTNTDHDPVVHMLREQIQALQLQLSRQQEEIQMLKMQRTDPQLSQSGMSHFQLQLSQSSQPTTNMRRNTRPPAGNLMPNSPTGPRPSTEAIPEDNHVDNEQPRVTSTVETAQQELSSLSSMPRLLQPERCSEDNRNTSIAVESNGSHLRHRQLLEVNSTSLNQQPESVNALSVNTGCSTRYGELEAAESGNPTPAAFLTIPETQQRDPISEITANLSLPQHVENRDTTSSSPTAARQSGRPSSESPAGAPSRVSPYSRLESAVPSDQGDISAVSSLHLSDSLSSIEAGGLMDSHRQVEELPRSLQTCSASGEEFTDRPPGEEISRIHLTAEVEAADSHCSSGGNDDAETTVPAMLERRAPSPAEPMIACRDNASTEDGGDRYPVDSESESVSPKAAGSTCQLMESRTGSATDDGRWSDMVAALRHLTEALVCEDNLPVIEADSLFQKAMCSVMTSQRVITAALASGDLSLFTPNALSVAITEHLQAMVDSYAVEHGNCPATESSAEQSGLIPDILLRKHAVSCSSEAEFRGLMGEKWTQCWDILLKFWGRLLALVDADTVVQSFTPVLVSSHIRHPKKLEKAAALLHVVIMDVFAEVLRGSADSDDGSLFESSTTLALSDDEGSLADTLPSANPLLDITPGKRIPEAIIPSDNHNSNDDTNPLVESHSTQSITSNVARTKSVERNTSALPTNGVSGESLFQTSSESDTSSLAPTVSPLQDTASAQQSPNKTISSESESEESEKSSEPTANFYNRFLASTHTMSLRSDVSDRSDAPEEDDLFLTLSSGPSALSRKRASLSPNPASALSSSRRASVLSDTFAMYGVKESDSDTDSS